MLQQALSARSETDLEKLLVGLLQDTDDATSPTRYQFFYRDSRRCWSCTGSGRRHPHHQGLHHDRATSRAVNLKVYGTFHFKGLEKSPLAGDHQPDGPDVLPRPLRVPHRRNLAEIEALKKEAGAQEVDRDKAEEELFGGGRSVVAEATPGRIDEKDALPHAATRADAAPKRAADAVPSPGGDRRGGGAQRGHHPEGPRRSCQANAAGHPGAIADASTWA